MKVKVLSLLVLFSLTLPVFSAEITTMTIVNPDKTLTRFFYVAGKEVAQQKQDRDGSVLETKGKIPDGVVKEFLEDGKLVGEWNYKNGKPEGLGKEYYVSGELLEEILFKNGKREGISKKYYKSGNLLAERNFRGGVLEGITRMYSESGKVIAELKYKDGKLDGETTFYYETGKPRSVEVYRANEKVREKAYNEEGALVFEKDYTLEATTTSTTTSSTPPQEVGEPRGKDNN